MNSEDTKKTASNREYGRLSYVIMPMRTCGTPAAFHSSTDDVFHIFMDTFVMGKLVTLQFSETT